MGFSIYFKCSCKPERFNSCLCSPFPSLHVLHVVFFGSLLFSFSLPLSPHALFNSRPHHHHARHHPAPLQWVPAGLNGQYYGTRTTHMRPSCPAYTSVAHHSHTTFQPLHEYDNNVCCVWVIQAPASKAHPAHGQHV